MIKCIYRLFFICGYEVMIAPSAQWSQHGDKGVKEDTEACILRALLNSVLLRVEKNRCQRRR